MSEPEEVIIDAARHVTQAVGALWRRFDVGREPQGASLLDQRRRIEILLAGLYEVQIPIRVARVPAPPTPLWRLFHRMPRWLIEVAALPANDGRQVYLPVHLDDTPVLSAERRFRILAIVQAGRVLRGTARLGALALSGLARDLYWIAEADAADRRIAADFPGLRQDLLALRQEALALRQRRGDRTRSEEAVERIYREVLEAPPWGVVESASPEESLRWAEAASSEGRSGDECPRAASPVVESSSPEESLGWAEAEAADIEGRCGDRFRGLVRDHWIGKVLPPRPDQPRPLLQQDEEGEGDRPRSVRLQHKPTARRPDDGEEDEEPGPLTFGLEQFHEHAEDPMGLQRPIDRGAGEESEGSADSLGELEETAVVSTPERAKEVFLADDPAEEGARIDPLTTAQGIRYPEWDHRIAAYRAQAVTVRLQPPAHGDPAWAEGVIERRRHLFHAVRRRFEGLQPRRIQLRRQPDGEDVDLDAWVEAHADLRAGRSLPERVYTLSRPRRRDLAIQLLVDVSGSTDSWVAENLRVIDVEKEALLVCCHALDILGDPYAIDAFSGEGPHGVAVWQVKAFDERDTAVVQRRIAALEPDRHTRAGAALRHAMAQLAWRKERHRLLLLLSDGKPNDVDVYEGAYGVEDMRQAVVEASAAGIQAFCLTIDRAAPRYVPRIFGMGGHATLAHASELPKALVDVLRRLVTS